MSHPSHRAHVTATEFIALLCLQLVVTPVLHIRNPSRILCVDNTQTNLQNKLLPTHHLQSTNGMI